MDNDCSGIGIVGLRKVRFATDASQDLCRILKINGFWPMDGSWRASGGNRRPDHNAAVNGNLSATK
jgi:hypothetical protein